MAYQNDIRSMLAALNICIKNDTVSNPVAPHIKELLTSEKIHIVDHFYNSRNAAIIYLTQVHQN